MLTGRADDVDKIGLVVNALPFPAALVNSNGSLAAANTEAAA
jgi:hypothetical protein